MDMMINRIIPVQKVLSISRRNSQLSQDRRKKKEQDSAGTKFTPIEKGKLNTNKRNA
ncbi:hypothetical protein [Anaerosporomusa subterranea]|uniref:hypothetical protein n=1 Tax=Anaerosporomusa subterranea TaxID=1794912 RepID=UPI0012E9438A|nr:hypothetical protein [Anaerosporomusa subterranea]